MKYFKENYIPQSWYPVCRANDLKHKMNKAINLFGKEWVIFRGETGKVGIINRYCSHMGTDLSAGKICNDNVICPLHNWKFDTNGTCTQSYYNENDNIHLNTLHVAEKYGLIFCFLGELPAFELPSFLKIDLGIYSSSFINIIDTPYIAFAINVFDQQHYLSIHNRKFVSEPSIISKSKYHLSFNFNAEIIPKKWFDYFMKLLGYNKFDISIDCWGANNLLVFNHNTQYGVFISIMPITENKSKFFMVCVADKKNNNLYKNIKSNFFLFIMRLCIKSFIKSDLKIIKNMSPTKNNLHKIKDSSLIKFWDYVENLPKFKYGE